MKNNMTERYLDLITEGYVIDNELVGIYDSKDLSNILLQSLREVRHEDIEVYEQINNLPILHRQQLLKTYLDLELYEDNDQDVELDSIEETEALAAGGVAAGVGKLVEIMIVAMTKFLSMMGSAFMWTLHTPYLLIPIALIIFFGYKSRRTMSRGFFGLVKKICEWTYKAANWSKTVSATWKYRYIMTYQNSERAYKSCEIDKKDINTLTIFGIKDKSKMADWIFSQTQEDAECLREKYLEDIIEKIKLFMEFYFDCLKKTGKWGEISNYTSDDKFLSFIMRSDLGSSCQTFYDQAKNLNDIFDELLDIVFYDTPHEKSNWNQKRLAAIMDVKKKIDKSAGPKKTFQNKKPNTYQNKKPNTYQNKRF